MNSLRSIAIIFISYSVRWLSLANYFSPTTELSWILYPARICMFTIRSMFVAIAIVASWLWLMIASPETAWSLLGCIILTLLALNLKNALLLYWLPVVHQINLLLLPHEIYPHDDDFRQTVIFAFISVFIFTFAITTRSEASKPGEPITTSTLFVYTSINAVILGSLVGLLNSCRGGFYFIENMLLAPCLYFVVAIISAWPFSKISRQLNDMALKVRQR